MKINKLSLLWACGFAVLLLSGLLWGAQCVGAGADTGADAGAVLAVPRTLVQETVQVTVALPIVYAGYPAPPPVFGTQMTQIVEWHGLSKAVDVGAYWMRYQDFSWDEIEPTRESPTAYVWSEATDESLRNAYANGLTTIATVQHTPEWAQKYSGSFCGPIREDRLDEFAEFLTALVNRYKDAPYGVKYWELGNEPDAPVSIDRRVYGCWGEPAKTYYGGKYYAKMLQAAYPAIKAADPKAQVLIGGLLLDCDPTHPTMGAGCDLGRFFEGVLRAGGGDYFDILSYHGYVYYGGTLDADLNDGTWGWRGGVARGKASYLQEVMQQYDIDKPFLLTEAALICHPGNLEHCNPPAAQFYEQQADYVVRLYARSWADGLLGTIWYSFEGPGWRNSGLLDENQDPRPAYDAYAFMVRELEGARYEGPVSQYSAVEGYAFAKPGARVWVLWSLDESAIVHIGLPANATRIYDKYGADLPDLPLTGYTFDSSEPIYVEMPR